MNDCCHPFKKTICFHSLSASSQTCCFVFSSCKTAQLLQEQSDESIPRPLFQLCHFNINKCSETSLFKAFSHSWSRVFVSICVAIELLSYSSQYFCTLQVTTHSIVKCCDQHFIKREKIANRVDQKIPCVIHRKNCFIKLTFIRTGL